MKGLLGLLPPRMVEGLVGQLLEELESLEPEAAARLGAELARVAIAKLPPRARSNLVALGDGALAILDPDPESEANASPDEELHQ